MPGAVDAGPDAGPDASPASPAGPYAGPEARAPRSELPPRWVKLIDQTACIGCHACTTACKSENQVPLGVTRTYVKSVDVGTFPQVRRAFQVTRCNQCGDAPCVAACPTGAMYRRPDGIVDFDKAICIGCKACMAACPYDAIFINPEDHSAEKCNFCAHRLEVGLEPACVVVCPTGAIAVGDLNDPSSRVAAAVQSGPVAVRRPEKETRPGLFYKGAHQATLDPLAARRPEGGLYAWASQGPPLGLLSHQVGAGHPGPPAPLSPPARRRPSPGYVGRRRGAAPGSIAPPTNGPNSSAAALISYDVPHAAPWGWPVSLYTWTKGIAAGAFLVPVVAALAGRLAFAGPVVSFAAPSCALALLGVTGAVLVADLEHPGRFWMLLTRPQPRSWLVKGAFILGAYGLVVALFLVASIVGSVTFQEVMAGLGLPLSVMTAGYTAYLFAQAKARDLWQSPLLPPHLAVQAALAGSAAMLPVALWVGPPGGAGALEVVLAAAAAAHLLLVYGEVTVAHVSAHAHLAVREMTRGRFAPALWPGLALVLVGVFAPLVGVAAVPCALAGLLLHEHAYVQAGQSVPLA